MNVCKTEFILEGKWFTVTYTGFRKMAEFKLVEESAFQPEAQCQEKHRGENQHGVLGKMDQ